MRGCTKAGGVLNSVSGLWSVDSWSCVAYLVISVLLITLRTSPIHLQSLVRPSTSSGIQMPSGSECQVDSSIIACILHVLKSSQGWALLSPFYRWWNRSLEILVVNNYWRSLLCGRPMDYHNPMRYTVARATCSSWNVADPGVKPGGLSSEPTLSAAAACPSPVLLHRTVNTVPRRHGT